MVTPVILAARPQTLLHSLTKYVFMVKHVPGVAIRSEKYKYKHKYIQGPTQIMPFLLQNHEHVIL